MRILGRFILPVLLAFPAAGIAHPHAWIELRMQLVFDAEGRVTALRQSWELDTFYSLIVLEQIQAEAPGDTLTEKLEHFGGEMLRQAADYNYMTELRADDEPVPLNRARSHTLERVDNRLHLHFELPLPEPLDPAAVSLSYAVFDPTFYIQINHADNGVTFQGADGRCQHVLHPPDPSQAAIDRAARMDLDASEDPELGQHFAERTEIQCTSAS